MAAESCLVLYGNSVFLAAIKTELERDRDLGLELLSVEAGCADVTHLIRERKPCAVLFDLGMDQPSFVIPMLREQPNPAKEGIDVEVIDLRTLAPLDKDAIFASLEKTNRVLVVHEDVKTLGLGAEIAALIMEGRFEQLAAPVLRVTYPDAHCPFSAVLEKFNLPNAEKVLAGSKRVAAY